jgi:hypothetical protein
MTPLTPIARKKKSLLSMANFSRIVVMSYFIRKLFYGAQKKPELVTSSTLAATTYRQSYKYLTYQ